MKSGTPDSANPQQTTDAEWQGNYFNYFTEVEDCFRKARGTGLFLLSPLDWALIESWRSSGVPLEAVLKGVNAAFEKWRSGKSKRRLVNSLAYCAQAVIESAARTSSRTIADQAITAPFAPEEIVKHLKACALLLRNKSEDALCEIAASLDTLALEVAQYVRNIGELENRLTVLEEKMVAVLRASQKDVDLLTIRHSLDMELRPYRGKMTADQLSMLERRYTDTALLERAKLPRLSLFYLH